MEDKFRIEDGRIQDRTQNEQDQEDASPKVKEVVAFLCRWFWIRNRRRAGLFGRFPLGTDFTSGCQIFLPG